MAKPSYLFGINDRSALNMVNILPQPRQETPGIDAKNTGIIAALLDYQCWHPQGAYHPAHFLEVGCLQRPAAGGVLARCIETERYHQVPRAVAANPVEGLFECLTVGSAVDVSRERYVDIQAPPPAAAFSLFKPTEIGVGIPGVPVDGNRQHVSALVENFLLAVAMVVIDIEHGDLAVSTE